MSSNEAECSVLRELFEDLPSACVALLIPTFFLYLSLYAFVKRWMWTFRWLSIVTLVGFWGGERVVVVRCAAVRALGKFAVAVATMKLLDIHALHLTSRFPTYTPTPLPPPSTLALILLTELRYESFTPNPIRHSPLLTHPFHGNEKLQLLLHITIFALLQLLPQTATVKALGVLLTIWILWTSLQQILRYKTSPPLFGPIYLADSLAAFWTETWHNAFASPCHNLAYTPTFFLLSSLGIPRPLARSAAVISSFALMAAFHVFALAPLVSPQGLVRVALFFVGNGVLTVAEVAVWGRKRGWVRGVCAWGVEAGLAGWTVRGLGIPGGLGEGRWGGLCAPQG